MLSSSAVLTLREALKLGARGLDKEVKKALSLGLVLPGDRCYAPLVSCLSITLSCSHVFWLHISFFGVFLHPRFVFFGFCLFVLLLQIMELKASLEERK